MQVAVCVKAGLYHKCDEDIIEALYWALDGSLSPRCYISYTHLFEVPPTGITQCCVFFTIRSGPQ